MKRLPMRKIQEAMRLSGEGLSKREMALSLAIGRTTLREYLSRARDAGFSWPLPDELSDADLEQLLFPRRSGDTSQPIPLPDWAYVHAELRRKGVTLALLWEEYRSVHPDGYGYSRYCELYTRWEGRLSPVMRQPLPGRRLRSNLPGGVTPLVSGCLWIMRATQSMWSTPTFGAARLDAACERVLHINSYTY